MTGSFFHTLAANAVANLVRNVWSHSVIMCGHFPEGVETFSRRSIVGETRGEWYLRQMLGSANISGGKLIHLLSGNLSYQIEHHIYPDLNSNRYQEVAPKVREVFDRYGLRYVTGPDAQAGGVGLVEGHPALLPQRLPAAQQPAQGDRAAAARAELAA